MNLEGFTPEQLEKAKACKTAEELVQLAKDEGVELTDEQLAGVSGGIWDCTTVTDGNCNYCIAAMCDVYKTH